MLILSLVASALIPTSAEPAAPAARSRQERPPVVLLIHGGAWLLGDSSSMLEAADLARAEGMQPVLVDYPVARRMDEIQKANRAVRQEARRWREAGRTVVAYGESAGGTMAELLAAECRVDLAAASSAPPDLVAWPEPDQNADLWGLLRTDPKTRSEYSPARRPQCRPVLAMSSPSDYLVRFHFAKSYADKFDEVDLLRIPGGHLGEPYRANTRLGLDWLRRGLSQTRAAPLALARLSG